MAVSVARVTSLNPVSGSAEEILDLLKEWDAAADPEPLVIATSGSTGQPKRVVLSRDAMRASALATHERLGGPGRWVLNLPPTYVAGVQVLYRSVVAGTEPVLDGDVADVLPVARTSRWCRRSSTGPSGRHPTSRTSPGSTRSSSAVARCRRRSGPRRRARASGSCRPTG